MMQRERAIVTGLVVLLGLLWLGFAVHRSPRFPGSVVGSALAIAGAALMLVTSLAYMAVKRISPLKQRIGRVVPLGRLLAWHVYGGIAGAILAILHTGHRFESTLGVVLTAMTLVTVFSGYVGRHFLRQVAHEVRDKQAQLGQLVSAYNELARQLAEQGPVTAEPGGRWSGLWRSLPFARGRPEAAVATLGYQAAELAGSIADLEYAIKTHELLKQRLATWLTIHIAASIAFYGLLGLHIWASVYFALRWLT